MISNAFNLYRFFWSARKGCLLYERSPSMPWMSSLKQKVPRNLQCLYHFSSFTKCFRAHNIYFNPQAESVWITLLKTEWVIFTICFHFPANTKEAIERKRWELGIGSVAESSWVVCVRSWVQSPAMENNFDLTVKRLWYWNEFLLREHGLHHLTLCWQTIP